MHQNEIKSVYIANETIFKNLTFTETDKAVKDNRSVTHTIGQIIYNLFSKKICCHQSDSYRTPAKTP